MLSLPAGVAAFAGNSQGVAPALALTAILGLLSAYGFVLIADACTRSGESTFAGAWGRTVSERTKWIPLTACAVKAGLGCVAFSMILGDCLPPILSPLGLPAPLASRSAAILLVTVAALLPLCRMRSLAPLAKFSALGVLSNVYVCFFIVLRCVDGSYRPGGAMLRGALTAPRFSAPASSAWAAVADPRILVLVSILSTAFLAHYNSPLFFRQLDPGAGGDRMRRFAVVSVVSFLITGCVFSTVMVGGFLTFGTSCSGLILNNYSASDALAFVARAAIALSLMTSYPLVFTNVRQQFVTLAGERGARFAAERPDALTVLLLATVTSLALSLRDLGKLVAISGAVFANFLIYIAPALMVLCAQRRNMGPCKKGLLGVASRACQAGMIPLGLVLGCIGVKMIF